MAISNHSNVEHHLQIWEEHVGHYSLQEAQQILDEADIQIDSERKIAAKVYALLARDRYDKRGRFDPIVKYWMEYTKSLYNQEPAYLYMAALEQLEYMKENIFTQPLPSMRETDQSSARKKAAGQLQDIAEKERTVLQQTIENIEHNHIFWHTLASWHDITKTDIMNILEEGKASFETLQQAANDYIQTASGSFYSPEAVQTIKSTISHINHLKKEWSALLKRSTSLALDKENPLVELQQMIGLENIKKRVHRLYHYLQYQEQRKQRGYHLQDERSLHMILTGNPGTGKTMLARMLAKIYHHLGVLQRDDVLEADRSQLVGSYVGQTEEKTMNLVKEAVGGVLFVDEAYSLKREGMSGNDFGQTAIDTLVSAMTSGEYAGTFVVILAGYPDEMRQFLQSNPGLRSRFPESNHIHLPDYSLDELVEIADKVALDNDFIINNDGKRELTKRIETEQVDETFGNARTVKNIVMDAIFQKGASIGGDTAADRDDFALLSAEDMKDPVIEEKALHTESPLEQLESLIGLDEVKQEMKKLTAFIRIQNERRKADMKTAPVQLHTVFTGPPGTGKTTVAQLYASILKDIGLLKRGHTIVCGRSDLVAEYTGQTAAKTMRKVREALGGVLFIDEAYSLASPSGADFGKEALDTLVDEMTKHGENLVVILSGYSRPMKQLFQVNPGLTSRFKKTFYFPPFTSEELTSVTVQYVQNMGYYFEQGAADELHRVYQTMDTSGNARFAVDFAEEIFQQHAFRIMNDKKTSTDSLQLIQTTDIYAAKADKQVESEDNTNESHSNKH
ncbi:AAA+-type ATPase, SpoVK/Ycf46/Vps4 family [Alteribacillus persepolensis]|uniref:AAA+-type ATPase, SpoVK/Ycf46/Vps4 family n=1 Tax=Alteribacillus persepolensis TaxID=568899 RepID=A0A1G7YZ08_9BACI|nr:AAA family ATPase [Alteribacillus persepolensis]SDH01644.1 AAA+-type ATPase, SpoVK/Ycf46/Vps4 family [Alteribacillus persepolensis]